MHRLVMLVLLLLVIPGCGGDDSNPVDPDPPSMTIPTPPTLMAPADPDACKVGQTLSPGERCKVGSAWFSVTDDGRGQFTDTGVNVTVGEGIAIGSFRARHQGNGRWIIEAI